MERRKFTQEFKREAVKLIQERGVTMVQASRELGVHGSVLRRWVQEFAVDPQQAFPGHGKMKPEQGEIERLGSAPILRTPYLRPIMGQEGCHGTTTEVYSRVQT